MPDAPKPRSPASPSPDRPDLSYPMEIAGHAAEAAALMKAVSHEGRLMTLCHLVSGERSVTELEQLLGARQAAVSQQLARLRREGLVKARREGKTILYAIADPRVARLMALMYELYCQPAAQAKGQPRPA